MGLLDCWDGHTEQTKCRWPLLTLFQICSLSPFLNPGHFSAQRMTEVDRGLAEWQFGDGFPKFDLISTTATLMTIVAFAVYVDRERSRAATFKLHRTTPVPLRPGSRLGFEVEQVEHLFHGDLTAKSVEVDSWHGSFSLSDRTSVEEQRSRSLSL